MKSIFPYRIVCFYLLMECICPNVIFATKTTKFISKLRLILNEASEEDPHIIQWPEDNSCGFIIHNRELLEEKYLSKHFKKPKYKSFLRELNYYGFKLAKNVPLNFSRGTFRKHYVHQTQHFQKDSEETDHLVLDIRSKDPLPLTTETIIHFIEGVAPVEPLEVIEPNFWDLYDESNSTW